MASAAGAGRTGSALPEGAARGELSAERLLAWFAGHRRDLPWRQNRDPYRVLVAEVMLQQTRVETVVAYYERFLSRFPTVQALAAAPETDVLKAWEGLGYYSRARHLHRAAREVAARYGGSFPQDPNELAQLPGVGPYTAAAVAAIAFNQPAAAVDGNVLRVMARALGIAEDVTRPAVRRRIAAIVQAMIPAGRASEFAEALMELGALVCTPRSPNCSACPWQQGCAAHASGQAEALPVRRAKSRPRPVFGAVALIDREGRVLVVRRPDGGLLAGMWEFPWAEAAGLDEAGPALAQSVASRLGLAVRVERELEPVRHVFSHLEWRLRVYLCRLVGEPGAHGAGTELRWASAAELSELAFGRAHRRIGQQWLELRELAGQAGGG
ncbi:MAG: A/G-specific adenine glycosylase [Bacillota bacterium]